MYLSPGNAMAIIVIIKIHFFLSSWKIGWNNPKNKHFWAIQFLYQTIQPAQYELQNRFFSFFVWIMIVPFLFVDDVQLSDYFCISVIKQSFCEPLAFGMTSKEKKKKVRDEWNGMEYECCAHQNFGILLQKKIKCVFIKHTNSKFSKWTGRMRLYGFDMLMHSLLNYSKLPDCLKQRCKSISISISVQSSIKAFKTNYIP